MNLTKILVKMGRFERSCGILRWIAGYFRDNWFCLLGANDNIPYGTSFAISDNLVQNDMIEVVPFVQHVLSVIVE